MDKEEINEAQYCSCIWCGQWITKDAYFKRVERKRDDPNVCKDCTDVRKSNGLQKYKSKRTNHPELGVLWCYIWNGELNDDWYPIDDNGKLYMPGLRICGLKDCVNTTHIIKPKVMQVTDHELILGMHEMQQHNRRNKVR